MYKNKCSHVWRPNYYTIDNNCRYDSCNGLKCKFCEATINIDDLADFLTNSIDSYYGLESHLKDIIYPKEHIWE